ncbi:hypothetical protein M514_23920 [Trichuris suis]|uniref:Uncharacterized protein n=1 Tax=Trichuris suis TaxID=68888 RepID=A0A085N383_9BILA|nr:hypothetical protein M514_23920 [Trichuris suis]
MWESDARMVLYGKVPALGHYYSFSQKRCNTYMWLWPILHISATIVAQAVSIAPVSKTHMRLRRMGKATNVHNQIPSRNKTPCLYEELKLIKKTT